MDTVSATDTSQDESGCRPVSGGTALDEAVECYFNSGSDADKERLFIEAQGFIHYFAKLYGGGFRMDDLMQTGNEGLLKALKQFDKNQGASFITYAGNCIAGEVRHFVRKESSYYAPGCIIGLQNRVNRVIDEQIKTYGTTPTAEEIADRLNVKVSAVAQIMRAGLVDFDTIETEQIKTAHLKSFQLPIEDRLLLEQAMKKLSDIQKKVVHMLFFRNLTQNQTAEKLGLTQKQVSRIKEKSMDVIKEEIK